MKKADIILSLILWKQSMTTSVWNNKLDGLLEEDTIIHVEF